MDNAEGNVFSDGHKSFGSRPDSHPPDNRGNGFDGYFQSVVDASPIGMLITDEHDRCVYTNQAYQTLSHQSAEQALGKPGLAYVHPDDCLLVAEFSHWTPGDNNLPQTEVRLIRPDGDTVGVRITIADRQDGARVRGQIHMIEDMTGFKSAAHLLKTSEDTLFADRARSEVRLNAVVDAVLTTDVRGDVTYMNRTAEVMTGWTLTEARGRPLSDV